MAPAPGQDSRIVTRFAGSGAGERDDARNLPGPPVPTPAEQGADEVVPPGYGPDPDYAPADVEPELTPPLPPAPRDAAPV